MLSLAAKALLSVLLLTVVMGVILFVTAGTLDYWQAWVYLLIFTITSLLTTIYLIRNDPELLKRRMRGGPTAEKRATQRVIMFLTSLAFMGLLVVPRTRPPLWLVDSSALCSHRRRRSGRDRVLLYFSRV